MSEILNTNTWRRQWACWFALQVIHFIPVEILNPKLLRYLETADTKEADGLTWENVIRGDPAFDRDQNHAWMAITWAIPKAIRTMDRTGDLHEVINHALCACRHHNDMDLHKRLYVQAILCGVQPRQFS